MPDSYDFDSFGKIGKNERGMIDQAVFGGRRTATFSGGNFRPDVLRDKFSLPDNLEPVNILAIGYADEEPASPDRHDQMRIPVSRLVSYDRL